MLTSDPDGIGFSFSLKALYEFTSQTRAGIAYTSNSEADMEGKVKCTTCHRCPKMCLANWVAPT